MNLKKYLYMFLALAVMLSGLIAQASATEIHSDIIWLEDIKCELMDPSALSSGKEITMPQSTGSINANVSPQSVRCVGQAISFVADDTVTFNCSYSPSSASLDFGVIASNGKFYYINVKGGSINQSIRISESGSYSVAIRNNSSQTVRVVGFVNY